MTLSGEGADELFYGYDLFKETVVRQFCLRQPESTSRPRLFDRLYPYLAPGTRAGEFWRRFTEVCTTVPARAVSASRRRHRSG